MTEKTLVLKEETEREKRVNKKKEPPNIKKMSTIELTRSQQTWVKRCRSSCEPLFMSHVTDSLQLIFAECGETKYLIILRLTDEIFLIGMNCNIWH